MALLLAFAFFVALNNTKATYTLADDGSHVLVLTQDQDVIISTSEDAWEVNKGLDYLPGTTLAKNPTIQNDASDCYLRVNFRITEKEEGTLKSSEGVTSKTIDPTASEQNRARCEQILKMIWYDSGSNLQEGTSYSSEKLNSYGGVEVQNVFNATDFEPEFDSTDLALQGWNNNMKAYSFLYKNQKTNDIFTAGSSAVFFTHLVIPSDLTDDEFALAGDYYINVWAQAVQTSSEFSSRSDAIDYLSDADVENDMSRIDNEEVTSDSKHKVNG